MAVSVRIGTTRWNQDERVLERAGQPIRLTRLEASLIHYLSGRLGSVVTTSQLLDEVWGYAPTVRTRAVENAVSRLRKKLGNDATQLQTVYGQGYCLLPTEDRALVGREAELEAVSDLIDTHPLVNLYGVGGVGKTSLARGLLRAYPTHIWVEFHRPLDPNELSVRLAEQLGLADTATDQLPAALQRLGPVLVVIDGAEHLGAEVVDLVRAWSTGHEVRWLLTSRILFADEVGYEVGPLSREAAIRLLRERAPVGMDDGDATRVGDLVDLVDRLPLGIELAAGRLRVLGIDEIVDWMKQHGLEVIDGSKGRLTNTLRGCWDLLDAPQQRCLCVGAWLDEGFRVDAVAAITGLSPIATLDALEGLLRTGMVKRQGQLYGMLDLVRSFAGSQITPGLKADFVQWAVAQARAIVAAGNEGETPSNDELKELATVFLRVLDDVGEPEPRAHLLLALRMHDRRRGPLLRCRPWFDALDVDALPPVLAAEVWVERGRLHTESDERASGLACHERASELAHQHGSPTQVARVVARHTIMVRMKIGPAASLPMARELLDYVDEHQLSSRLRVMALECLESSLTTLGEFEEAHRAVLQALALLPADLDLEVQWRTRLGYILNKQGEFLRSRRELERAFAIAKDVGADRRVTQAGRQLGNLCSNTGDHARAREVYDEVARIAEEIGDSAGAFAARLGSAGLVAETDVGEALNLYEAIREHARLVGRAREASVASLNIGLLRHGAGELDAAEAAYRECITTIDPIGWRYIMSLCRSFVALLQAELGRLDEARRTLTETEPGSNEATRIRDAVRAALDGDHERVAEHLAGVAHYTAETVQQLVDRL